MNDHSKLNPELLITQATWAIHFLRQKNERLREARIPMIAFINATEVSTGGINRLKQKMSDLLSIMNALILAYSSHISDYRRLIARLEGVPIIDGAVTLASIRRTQENIRDLQSRINGLERSRHMERTLPDRSPVIYDQLGVLIRILTSTLETQRSVLRVLNARVDLYGEIEYETRTMLREGSEMEAEALRGFEMINQASSGLPNSFSHPGLSAWRVNLQEKKDRREGPTLEEIDFIDYIRSSGTPFPADWSEERKVEFTRQFFADMVLIDAFLDEYYPIYDFSVDFNKAEARRTAFFFLVDHSLAFDLNLAQRKELLHVLESTNMAGDVREFFVDLGFEDNRRFLSLGEAGSAGARARMVYTAAQDGSTYSNWFAGLVKIGGVLSINSLSNAGLIPMVKPPNPAHSRGWVPNRPIIPPATPKPKPPVQSSSNLPPVRTITLNNGRVIRLSSPNATFVRGNLQSPTIPRMIKVNGKWVRMQQPVSPALDSQATLPKAGDPNFIGPTLPSDLGGVFGNIHKLTPAEKQVARDLASRGNTVEVVYRNPPHNTPDFRVNGIPTELKTIANPNVNTAVTRIKEGFGQNADAVIIDTRGTGLTNAQAMEAINRASGTFSNRQLPGRVEIWTDSGIVTN